MTLKSLLGLRLILQSMPGWRLTSTGKAIQHVKSFPSSQIAALYSAFVTGYAGAVALPAAVNILGGKVEVTLHAPRTHGRIGALTVEVLELARQLS